MKAVVNFLAICATVLTLASLGATLTEGGEESTPAALIITPERLVSQSPWNGTWDGIGTNYRGTLELVFSFRESKLVGEIQNITGTSAGNGPVGYLEIADGRTVKFQVPRTGTVYELSLNERGQLAGKGQRRYGAATEMVLSPTLKGTSK